jgi:hypothetical protein
MLSACGCVQNIAGTLREPSAEEIMHASRLLIKTPKVTARPGPSSSRLNVNNTESNKSIFEKVVSNLPRQQESAVLLTPENLGRSSTRSPYSTRAPTRAPTRAVFIHPDGDREPEALTDLKGNGDDLELPYSLQMSEGDDPDAWCLVDESGKDVLKLRFSVQQSALASARRALTGGPV